MTCILPEIDSLEQHLSHLDNNRQAYCPEYCPHCGFGTLHIHGNYYRKADKEGSNGVYLDPIPIPRFLCVGCGATCSCLPSCIPPYRWYLWAAQQTILLCLLRGMPVAEIERQHFPSRHTIRRWSHWINERFAIYKFCLCSHISALGFCPTLCDFWLTYLQHGSLDNAMVLLHRAGELVYENRGIIS